MFTSGMDLAALCEQASNAASKACAVSDVLHIELVSNRVRHFWPEATGWSRQFVPYDDMPGGDWYLLEVVTDGSQYDYRTWSETNVIDSQSAEHDDWREEIDNILADVWEQGESNEIRVVYIEVQP